MTGPVFSWNIDVRYVFYGVSSAVFLIAFFMLQMFARSYVTHVVRNQQTIFGVRQETVEVRKFAVAINPSVVILFQLLAHALLFSPSMTE